MANPSVLSLSELEEGVEPPPLPHPARRRVLLVAYEFPPMRTSGVYRPLKFARYLADFGWDPVVLTVRNPRAGQWDPSLLNELPPGVEITQATTIEPERLEQWIFNHLFHRSGPASSPASPAAPSPGELPEKKQRGGVREQVRKTVLSPLQRLVHHYLWVPDAQIGWLAGAVLRGVQLSFDAIITTSPPHSTQLVGLVLAHLTGRPWIADFRDPWVDNFNTIRYPPLRRRWDTSLERAVLRRADRIVNVGANFSALSCRTFPEIPPHKHLIIPNGYDEADFQSLDGETLHREAETEELRLLNVGTIYPNSGFASFVTALESLLDDPSFEGRLRLGLVGDLDTQWVKRFSAPRFTGRVDRMGFLPHHQALHTMVAADVLLLVPAGGTERTNGNIMPGKLFELMRCGRPILMIGWPGEAQQIAEQSGLGRFVPANDPPAIAAALRDLWRQKSTGALRATPNWDIIHQYERRALAGRLAQALDEIAATPLRR